MEFAPATLPSGEDGGSKCKEAPNEGPRRRRGDVWMPCAREGRCPLENARGIEAVWPRRAAARFKRARPEGARPILLVGLVGDGVAPFALLKRYVAALKDVADLTACPVRRVVFQRTR